MPPCAPGPRGPFQDRSRGCRGLKSQLNSKQHRKPPSPVSSWLRAFASPPGGKPSEPLPSQHRQLSLGELWARLPTLTKGFRLQRRGRGSPRGLQACSQATDETSGYEEHLLSSVPGLPACASGIFFIVWFLMFWALQSPLRIYKL